MEKEHIGKKASENLLQEKVLFSGYLLLVVHLLKSLSNCVFLSKVKYLLDKRLRRIILHCIVVTSFLGRLSCWSVFGIYNIRFLALALYCHVHFILSESFKSFLQQNNNNKEEKSFCLLSSTNEPSNPKMSKS